MSCKSIAELFFDLFNKTGGKHGLYFSLLLWAISNKHDFVDRNTIIFTFDDKSKIKRISKNDEFVYCEVPKEPVVELSVEQADGKCSSE